MQRVIETPSWLLWLYVAGEPSRANARVFEGPLGWIPTFLLGGFLSWAKIVGLFCLLVWLGTTLFRRAARPTPSSRSQATIQVYLAGAVLVLGLLAALLGVMEETGRIKLMAWGPYKPGTWVGMLAGAIVLLLIEWRAWTGLDRRGSPTDKVVLIGIHLALLFGYWVAFMIHRYELLMVENHQGTRAQLSDWQAIGARLGATYMGLIVFVRVACSVLAEVSKIRFRRLYAIAWQTIVEANRRMSGALRGRRRVRGGPGVHALVPAGGATGAAPSSARCSWARSRSSRRCW